MKIFLILSLLIITILLVGRIFIYSAKINLFKDQAAWSGKDLKINYNKNKKGSGSNKNENYLKMIAEESEIFLEDQSKKKIKETNSD